MTRKCFIDRVIDNLEHHVMQTGSVIGVTDVHTWSFANGFEAF
jgi:hypothetical protein